MLEFNLHVNSILVDVVIWHFDFSIQIFAPSGLWHL